MINGNLYLPAGRMFSLNLLPGPWSLLQGLTSDFPTSYSTIALETFSCHKKPFRSMLPYILLFEYFLWWSSRGEPSVVQVISSNHPKFVLNGSSESLQSGNKEIFPGLTPECLSWYYEELGKKAPGILTCLWWPCTSYQRGVLVEIRWPIINHVPHLMSQGVKKGVGRYHQRFRVKPL